MLRVPLATVAAVAALTVASGPLRAQSRARATTRDSTSTVAGTVTVHETGKPLSEVSVSLGAGDRSSPGRGTRITDASGGFSFEGVPAGTYHLLAAFIGYHDLSDTLEVPAQSDLRLDLELSVDPVELQPLVVVTNRNRYVLSGFERRRARGLGTFITREQIEQEQPSYVSQLLRTVPGVRLTPVRGGRGYSVLLRGGCRADIWIDRVRVLGDADVDDLLRPYDVEAVEVYHGAEVPVLFEPSPCGAVVFWTRVARPASSRGSLWTRSLVALAFVALAYLLTR